MEMNERDRENYLYCANIVEDLRQYDSGVLYRTPDNDIINIEDYDIIESEDGNEVIEITEGEFVEVDECEQLSLYDYFDDYLDIQYIVQSDRQTLDGVRILVTCGGPNVYINTYENEVQLYWWAERANAYIDNDIANAITDIFQEFYNC